jgi:single-strand DNA-binding protein
MKSVNKVIILGNVGSDPEIKYTPSGTTVCNLRIATSENRKNKDGEWEEKTEWHRVIVFGKTAEACKDYLRKGSKVYIEGKIETRSWDDKEGQKHYATDIIGNDVVFLDSKASGTRKEVKEADNKQQIEDDNESLPF